MAPLMLAAGLAGCMTYTTLMHPGERTRLEELRVGMTREEVEAVVGRPDGADRNAVLYEVHTDQAGPSPSRLWLPATIVADAYLFVLEPMFAAAQHDALGRVRGLMAIVYGPDGRAIGLYYDGAVREYRTFLAAEDPAASLRLLCASANAGYAPAAHAQAARYFYGLWRSRIDYDTAYLWASLAEFAGLPDARQLRLGIAAGLSPARRADLDARFRQWRPLPCTEDAGQEPAARPRLSERKPA